MIKLKSKVSYALYFLLALVFVRCGKAFPVKEGFRVHRVEEFEKYTDYHLVPIKGMTNVYLRDSVHKYRIGDTIRLVPN